MRYYIKEEDDSLTEVLPLVLEEKINYNYICSHWQKWNVVVLIEATDDRMVFRIEEKIYYFY